MHNPLLEPTHALPAGAAQFKRQSSQFTSALREHPPNHSCRHPALFHVRPRTRENALTLDELRALGITPESVATWLEGSTIGWLWETPSGEVVGFWPDPAVPVHGSPPMWINAFEPMASTGIEAGPTGSSKKGLRFMPLELRRA